MVQDMINLRDIAIPKQMWKKSYAYHLFKPEWITRQMEKLDRSGVPNRCDIAYKLLLCWLETSSKVCCANYAVHGIQSPPLIKRTNGASSLKYFEIRTHSCRRNSSRHYLGAKGLIDEMNLLARNLFYQG